MSSGPAQQQVQTFGRAIAEYLSGYSRNLKSFHWSIEEKCVEEAARLNLLTGTSVEGGFAETMQLRQAVAARAREIQAWIPFPKRLEDLGDLAKFVISGWGNLNGNDAQTIVDFAQRFIRLACIEVCNIRRLSKARLELDDATTILVGANNCGKTSLLIALRNFLSDSPGFRAFDISLSHWAKLRQLSELWQALDEDPTTESKDAEKWEQQHRQLLGCMPFINLWFDAKEGAYNDVAPFITSLKWRGGAVVVGIPSMSDRITAATAVPDP